MIPPPQTHHWKKYPFDDCFKSTFNHFISYEDQSLDVDRLYPSLEMRQYLANTLLGNHKSNPINVIRPSELNLVEFNDDDLEDIFTMSTTDSNSPDEETLFDDNESLYCDALSRKASIVRISLKK